MKKTKLILILVVLLAVCLFLGNFIYNNVKKSDELLINDVSRLNPTQVNKIVKHHEIESLIAALNEAREKGLKVSIAGKRHSMGGHAFYDNAVVLDMTSFNQVLGVNTDEKTVTVQSGALWRDVIQYINDDDLSIQVMQAYSDFTIGGSLSVNVHESDPRYGSLIETVKSFRLLLADGSIITVSRQENPELFGLVIGGYGLFGVILDVDLYLTDNNVYSKNEFVIDYKDYLTFFKESSSNSEVENIFARLSIVSDETLLKEMVVTTYTIIDDYSEEIKTLKPSKKSPTKKFFMGLSRKYDFGKKLRWYGQKKLSNFFEPKLVSRNNLMNMNINFLDYYSEADTDILQEYFIPVAKLPEFIDSLRGIVDDNNLNLLSATIRYLPIDNETFLSYAPQESFGVVLYFNVGLSDEEQAVVTSWTQQLTDVALNLNGTYYLPYQLYATQNQIRKAYNIDEFFVKKKHYDPQELFVNTFYKKYKE